MNFSIFCIFTFLAIIAIARQDDDVVEKFHWKSKTNESNFNLEFYVVGKKVSWSAAKTLCGSKEFNEGLSDYSLGPEDVFDDMNSTTSKKNLGIVTTSRLAVLEDDNIKSWLSRMLSESNYRYDGLWIGGHRTNSTSSNWTWLAKDSDEEEIAISSSTFFGNYPEWYKVKEHRDMEKNCLIFDRVGHDLPILVPTDCQLSKPVLCSRAAKKTIPKNIVEGLNVTVDGYSYTVFSVDDGQKDTENWENTSGFRKLNGGGIKWKDARLECRKRGLYLATVLNNDAVNAIARIMLKNRPSMESAWLGGWSSDGIDWTWSPTGFELTSTKSSISEYPPWLSGHPVSSSVYDDDHQRRGRCLILDRHLCPDNTNPVFLDLDCEKERPFICQNGIPQRSGIGNNGAFVARKISVGKRTLVFSANQMTWNEGREYCANNQGRIASIIDSETLAVVLDKMTELDLDHIWVGGRTEKRPEGWRWFDETGKALSRKDIGTRSSWCLGDDEGWPNADPETCLNLDREGHGMPLFYGLPCDFAKQSVLCNIDQGSRSLFDASATSEVKSAKTVEDKLNNRRSMRPTKIDRKNKPPNQAHNLMENFTAIDKIDDNNKSPGKANISLTKKILDKFDTTTENGVHKKTTKNNEKVDKSVKEQKIDGAVSNNTKTRVADLDEETKKMLEASGYNLSDPNLVLHWEVELVDLADNSTVIGITELATLLGERIASLGRINRSGVLFVLDDSFGVLNVWLAQQLKFVAVLLRNFFQLSEDHRMGLLTLSKISKLGLNQTDECSVLAYINNKILGKRGFYRNGNKNHEEGSNNLIQAAAEAADIVSNSELQRIAIVFILDGEHKVSNANNKQELQSVAKKLQDLRNTGHEAYALFVGQNLKTSNSFDAFQELFSDSKDGQRNIYSVQSFSELSELVASINSTAPKPKNNLQCEEPHWIVPKEPDHTTTSFDLRTKI